MMMRVKRIVATSLLVAIALGGLAASTSNIQKFRYRPYLYDSLYLPSGNFLSAASLGYKQLVADVVWFSAIQYYGDFRMDNHGLEYFEGLIEIVTKLDPKFTFAYVFGGLIISNDLGDLGKGIDVLKRGMGENPTEWQLPFEIGFLHYIHRVDYNVGARYFDLASKLPGAPERTKRFAAIAYDKGGSDESALRIWEEYLELTDDPHLRELAQRYIDRIKAGEPLYPVVPSEQKPEAETGEANDYNRVYAD